MKLCPSEIRYTQESIGNTFNFWCQHSNKRIGETLDDICEMRCSIDSIPTISVAYISGKWRAADNKRLWVFKQLEILGKCNEITVNKISIILSFKQTSNNDGQIVRIIGYPGGKWFKIAYKQTIDKLRQNYLSEDLSMLRVPGEMSQSHTVGGNTLLQEPRSIPQAHVVGGLQQSLTPESQLQTSQTHASKGMLKNHAPVGKPKWDWPRSLSRFLARRGMSQLVVKRRSPNPYVREGQNQWYAQISLLQLYSSTNMPPAPGSMSYSTIPEYLQNSFPRDLSQSHSRRGLSHSNVQVSMPKSHARKALYRAFLLERASENKTQEVTSYSDSDDSLNQAYEGDYINSLNQTNESDSNDSIHKTYEYDSDDSLNQNSESDCDNWIHNTFESDDDDRIIRTYESESSDSNNHPSDEDSTLSTEDSDSEIP